MIFTFTFYIYKIEDYCFLFGVCLKDFNSKLVTILLIKIDFLWKSCICMVMRIRLSYKSLKVCKWLFLSQTSLTTFWQFFPGDLFYQLVLRNTKEREHKEEHRKWKRERERERESENEFGKDSFITLSWWFYYCNSPLFTRHFIPGIDTHYSCIFNPFMLFWFLFILGHGSCSFIFNPFAYYT